MKYIKNINEFVTEVIKVPIKVGDTILGGRFKNKKIVVKKIGKNDKGDITINGKPLLKFRIIKEGVSYDALEDDVNVYLSHLKDDGFSVNLGGNNKYYIRIYKPIDSRGIQSYSNSTIFSLSDIEDDVKRLISILSKGWEIDYVYVIDEDSDRVGIKSRDDLWPMKNDNLNLNKIMAFVIGVKEI